MSDTAQITICKTEIIYGNDITEILVDFDIQNVEVIEAREVVNLTINNSGSSLEFGTKHSGDDAGTRGDFYFDDDYMYVCTTSGTAITAIWKKLVLLRT